MPKKTRKEKLLARARRIVAQQPPTRQAADSYSPGESNLPDHKPYTYVAGPAKAHQSAIPTEAQRNEYADIRKDLVKTVALSLAILTLEFILYWRFNS
jgi:hypothetical protein